MKVVDRKGREHSIQLIDYIPKTDDDRPRSSLHLRARQLLKQEYPFDSILEEVPIPGEHLFIDFFLPNRRLVIEVQGQQHFEYSSLFHKTISHFINGQQRDKIKRLWCELNNFILIELIYDESDDQWRERIKNC